ncbi:DUF6049 family protein [Bifidobacterium apri]|uniref:DUF6049 family protein n=1 Tax=Bifidobacterium apri TaxID=1769423 RepID=UPI0039926AE5
MAIRQETEQAGITLNYPAHHGVRLARMQRLLRLLVACILAVVVPSMFGYAAADASTVTATGKASGSSSTAASRTTSRQKDSTISMSIDSATPVVTASSGYHLQLTLRNTSSVATGDGTVTVAANALYTFVSRTDIQDWAQGQSRIPMNNQLSQVDVGSIAAHGTTTVTVDIDASAAQLAAITSWGPKPVRISYASASGSASASLHTFLTRSTDGLTTADTPAMNITVVQPLSTTAWQSNTTIVSNIVNAEHAWLNSSSIVRAVFTGTDASKHERAESQLLTKHAKLQVVADPMYLQSMSIPAQASAISQPGMFDITGYAALNTPAAYQSAGVNTTDWNASASMAAYRSAVGSTNATHDIIAWQGSGRWTSQALNTAREQGYSTVIATSGYDADSSGTVHTGKYVVSTDFGDVTVLAAQQELTGLAQGKATSSEADSETSDAGRLSRFVAQSAFYQMEQPYTSRNLLVCLKSGASTALIDTLMSAIEQSTWLNLTDLNTLIASDAYASGADAASLVPQSSGLSEAARKRLEAALSTFAASARSLSQFKEHILYANSTSSPSASATASTSNSGDEQSLARHDATKVAENNAKGPSTWMNCLASLHSRMGVLALSGNAAVIQRMGDAATGLSSTLLNNVSITQTDTVTVVSETASLPVTVTNANPYPVRVRVSSLTDSMEIVTSRYADVTVPARGEAQVTFTIRVATSGSTSVHLTLLDRKGSGFSSAQTTTITSSLQISDKTGIAFIGVAFLLGVLGLWRQFHRKKDPDE